MSSYSPGAFSWKLRCVAVLVWQLERVLAFMGLTEVTYQSCSFCSVACVLLVVVWVIFGGLAWGDVLCDPCSLHI